MSASWVPFPFALARVGCCSSNFWSTCSSFWRHSWGTPNSLNKPTCCIRWVWPPCSNPPPPPPLTLTLPPPLHDQICRTLECLSSRELCECYLFCCTTSQNSCASTTLASVTSFRPTASRWGTWSWARSRGTCGSQTPSHQTSRYGCLADRSDFMYLSHCFPSATDWRELAWKKAVVDGRRVSPQRMSWIACGCRKSYLLCYSPCCVSAQQRRVNRAAWQCFEVFNMTLNNLGSTNS